MVMRCWTDLSNASTNKDKTFMMFAICNALDADCDGAGMYNCQDDCPMTISTIKSNNNNEEQVVLMYQLFSSYH